MVKTWNIDTWFSWHSVAFFGIKDIGKYIEDWLMLLLSPDPFPLSFFALLKT